MRNRSRKSRGISRDQDFLTFAKAANQATTTLLCYAEISYLFSLANGRLDDVARITDQSVDLSTHPSVHTFRSIY